MAQIETNGAGKIMSNVIELRWGVELKTTRIYEILNELNLSYQKAHINYANASQEQQKTFILSLKKLESKKEKEKIVFFDEFAVYERPSIFYGWAQKKIHAPEVTSNEKGCRNKLNGMISVDANTCLEYLKLKEKSKTEDVSDYFLQCSQNFSREGFDKLTIILDQDLTDKKKMKSQLKFHVINAQISDKIVVDFIHTPTYSPNFNLVEYIICLLYTSPSPRDA